MFRALLLTTAIALAAPAAAQTGAATQQPVPGNSQAGATGDAVVSIVETEFPAYDQNNDGQLDKAEFSRWMVALKDQEMKATGRTLGPDQVSAWAEGAFVTADADKSISVSKPELISYLSGGAG